MPFLTFAHGELCRCSQCIHIRCFFFLTRIWAIRVQRSKEAYVVCFVSFFCECFLFIRRFRNTNLMICGPTQKLCKSVIALEFVFYSREYLSVPKSSEIFRFYNLLNVRTVNQASSHFSHVVIIDEKFYFYSHREYAPI